MDVSRIEDVKDRKQGGRVRERDEPAIAGNARPVTKREPLMKDIYRTMRNAFQWGSVGFFIYIIYMKDVGFLFPVWVINL